MLGAVRFAAFLDAQPLREMSVAPIPTSSASYDARSEENETEDVIVFYMKDFTDALIRQSSESI
jgi:hypothetical protein